MDKAPRGASRGRSLTGKVGWIMVWCLAPWAVWVGWVGEASGSLGFRYGVGRGFGGVLCTAIVCTIHSGPNRTWRAWLRQLNGARAEARASGVGASYLE